jgi:AcrR family transcriptional regulator
MVEAHGAEALSMRKLAAELGVTTNTIYWHVGTREELLLAVVRLQAADQANADVLGKSPEDRIVSASLNIWRNARAHRNVTALAHSIGATTLLELPLEQTLLAEFNAAGVSGNAARDGLRAILMCTAGFLVGAWRGEANTPPELRNSLLWGEVSDDRIDTPTLAAMTTTVDIDALFEATLRSVVRGILSQRPRRRARS